ncbi:MAG: adenosylcobinamide-GDP ribazoletransferase [Fusobacteriaceae bacterium]|jgi:adenosylcobinamide-GDP ribazoletransferase|nr:adenosylcobinamide-GDP ribazoletransferase [Fusobacteriaceae bacterium]
MNGIIQLFKFMTRFPLFGSTPENEGELGKSMKFFPLVGFAIGVVLYIFLWILAKLLPGGHIFVITTIIAAIGVMITGDMHLRGLAATYDSIFKYRSRQKMLDMMKDDVSIGTNGAMALGIALLLKIFLLGAMLPKYPSLIMLVPVAGRLNCVVNCTYIGAAKNTGKAKLFADNTKVADLMAAVLITVGVVAVSMIFVPSFANYRLILFFLTLFAFAATVIAGYLFGYWMKKRIGGITGHTLGAVVEQSEVLFLLIIYMVLAGTFTGYL